ncbi:uncharacterized protein FIBRA_01305 [Fibroporia radiculosa]|uniref:Uncharacterized protein n=1 Tax=Fibroporia radiculosa TaxID=599839 RepID=J4H111_9APHY|nr:uncharacterized protein FIBRA_01305 [Fibroporia radiculosa]CCL99289.1 predicted protein [Fibroporia radiculosa]
MALQGAYGLEASYALLAYLDPSDHRAGIEFDPVPFTLATSRPPSQGLVVIELGSGTGLVASRLADGLVPERDLLLATDLPDVCTLLGSNLAASPAACVCPLSWGNSDDVRSVGSLLGVCISAGELVVSARFPTHIICSDLVYFPALLAPLLRTLLHLTTTPFLSQSGSGPILIISYKIRSLAKETPFWSAFGLWFSFSPVLVRNVAMHDSDRTDRTWSRFTPTADDDKTFVFVAHRRAESLVWTVPESDEELLRGVGAYGNSGSKADDTFETILLMTMESIDT